MLIYCVKLDHALYLINYGSWICWYISTAYSSGVSRIWRREVLRQWRTKCACRILIHTPKTLTTPLANVFLKIAGWQRRLFWPSSDEKELFRERILKSSKFIVDYRHKQLPLSYWSGCCARAEGGGVLEHPELPLEHAMHALYSSFSAHMLLQE